MYTKRESFAFRVHDIKRKTAQRLKVYVVKAYMSSYLILIFIVEYKHI